MLRMKKNFIGIALVATLFVGCQTAQLDKEMETVNLDERFAGYGSDRRPASVTPLVNTALKALERVTIKSGTKEISAHQAFIDFANRGKVEAAEIMSAKTSRFNALSKAEQTKIGSARNLRLDAEDLKGLKPETQAKIVSAFLKSENMKNMPGLNALRAEVDEVMVQIASSDMRAGGRAMMKKVSAGDAAVNKNVRMKAAEEQVFKSSDLSKSFKNLEEALTAGAPNAQDVKRKIYSLRKTAGEIWEVTGDSHLIPETCENLDLATIDQYTKLLAEVRDEFRSYSKEIGNGRWERINCKNKDKITAYVAGRFQQSLGRQEWAVPVQEMTFCKYLKDEVALGARALASENGGKLVKPACN